MNKYLNTISNFKVNSQKLFSTLILSLLFIFPIFSQIAPIDVSFPVNRLKCMVLTSSNLEVQLQVFNLAADIFS
ncbi:MAG: hypothetical protein R2771_10220 [Saprospiraceae bacterium]